VECNKKLNTLCLKTLGEPKYIRQFFKSVMDLEVHKITSVVPDDVSSMKLGEGLY